MIAIPLASESLASRRLCAAVGLALSLCVTLPAYSDDKEPEDHLPSKDRKLVAGLIERGLPELVELHLADNPPMHRCYIARAYAKAGEVEKVAALRDRFLAKAAEEYRRVIKLRRDLKWMRGERRKFDVSQWAVELGDMILHHWIVADLDQYEITSGLQFDRQRLIERLAEAREAYALAEDLLDDLEIGLDTDLEHYQLLGLEWKIRKLIDQHHLNSAWADYYAALVSPTEDKNRTKLLDDSLAAFDNVALWVPDQRRKYNAILGSAVVLREMGGFPAAASNFERVIDSTAPMSITTRAQYEYARSLIKARRFDRARRELDRLGAQPTRLKGEDAGALFYIRIAPLVHAFSYLHESELPNTGKGRRKSLRESAHNGFVAIAAKGGPWPGMVQVYLDSMAGQKRDLADLSSVEVALSANRLMSQEDYPGAIKAWEIILKRPDVGEQIHEARLNLGVCYFQIRETRKAAEIFLAEARSKPPLEIATKAYEYAYRCWRQLSATSHSREDYRKLADAAGLLAGKMPEHPSAPEAGWVASLALEEAGDFREAIDLYERVPTTSDRYWDAQRNAARCRQRVFESLAQNASVSRRQDRARRAADAWLELAEALSKLKDNKVMADDVRVEWIRDARLAAASMLTSDDLKAYRECLTLLDGMKPGSRVIGLQIRCLQKLGRIKDANRILEAYLQQEGAGELGAVLVRLAAEMESEMKHLRETGRKIESRHLASETLPTIRHLLRWIRSEPSHAEYVPVVEASLVNTLIQAERFDEAVKELDRLMAESPNDGTYVKAAATVQERIAESGAGNRERALNKAEALWATLLKDPTLVERSPDSYWEARYNWLKHQLRHGRASEVLRGIESERAWHPNLGGPPWQGLLLRLADKARSSAGTSP